MRVVINKMTRATQHSHPKSANDRDAAVTFLTRISLAGGYRPYHWQITQAEQSAGRVGHREWYFGADVKVSRRNDPIQSGDFVIMIDSDYYAEMPQMLATARPYGLYTFSPRQASNAEGEYTWCFNEHNEVVVTVSGGAQYKHMLWSYGTDTLMVSYKAGFWSRRRTAQYLVERRDVSDTHQVVLLTPLAQWYGWDAWLAYKWLESPLLERFTPVEGDFVRLTVSAAEGLSISTARTSSYACTTLPAAKDHAIATIARTSRVPLNTAQVQAFTGSDRAGAAALVEFHRLKTRNLPPIVYSVPNHAKQYQPFGPSYESDSKTAVSSFMNPIVDGAFSPDLVKANEERAVAERVVKVKSHSIVTKSMAAHITDFVELLVPTPHDLHPHDVDAVWERQSRPTQRHQIMMAGTEKARKYLATFLKKEAYQKPGDPRVITTFDSQLKVRYSEFMYAVSDHLKTQPWYAFGVTPLEIAENVCQVLSDASNCSVTDFSRFDGTISEVCRELEWALLARLFPFAYHMELEKLHKATYGNMARTTHGVIYAQGLSRGSGEPGTSALNTVINKFCNYLSHRLRGYDSITSFEAKGIFGGDDGLAADVDESSYVKASSMLGLKLTLEIHQRGDAGVEFLSRVYSPDVWFGDLNSMSSLYRALSKFHTTHNLPDSVTPVTKLIEKSMGYYLTDAHTPILGDFVTKVIELAGGDAVSPKFIHRYWSQYQSSDQFPNNVGEWAHDYVQRELVAFGFDHQAFLTWLAKADDVTYLLTPPCFMEPKPTETKCTVVVDGEVIETEGAAPPPKLTKAARRRDRRKAAALAVANA
jgi:hypothetical protein